MIELPVHNCFVYLQRYLKQHFPSKLFSISPLLSPVTSPTGPNLTTE